MSISPECAVIILSHIGDSNLSIVQSTMEELLSESDNKLWKRKTEELLGHTTEVQLNDWKRVYMFLNIGESLPSIFGKAAECGHVDVVKLLLKDPRVNPSAHSNYAIGRASENGHVDVVKLLLKDSRVNPSAVNNQAIRMSADNGHADVVRLLLKDPRVDAHAQHNYAIRRAAENGYIEVVRLLIESDRN